MLARIERSDDGAEIVVVLSLTPREFLAVRQGSEAAGRAMRAALLKAEAREAAA